MSDDESRIRRNAEDDERAARRVRDEAEDAARRSLDQARRAKPDAEDADESVKQSLRQFPSLDPDFLPSDVSLRIAPGANLEAAQGLIPAAKQLLFRALNLQQDGKQLVRLLLPGRDGSLITVFLQEGLKHVYIAPGKVTKAAPKKEEKKDEDESVVYLMLNGLVRPGTLVEGAAHEFHPTAICADAYNLKYEYQDMLKLGVEGPFGKAQANFPKPSQYSGAMKRVVQALYGIGKTMAASVDDDLAGAGELTITNPYLFHWLYTHGAYLDADDVWWLIEISKDRGVLKMGLPLISGTDSGGLAAFFESLGDTESAGVVAEFGGLPSGETFPDGDDLTDAIIAGDVIRLATSDDLKPFYIAGAIAKEALWPYCGWAFSESGRLRQVHNTSFWYQNYAFATIFETARYDWEEPFFGKHELLTADGSYPDSVVASMAERAKTAEHWKLTLDDHGVTLDLVERSYVAGPSKKTFDLVPGTGNFDFDRQVPLRVNFGSADQLYPVEFWGRPPTSYHPDIAIWNNTDCPIMAFYRGDVLEVLRHQPERTYTGVFQSYAHPQNYSRSPFYGVPDSSTTTDTVGAGLTCTTTRTGSLGDNYRNESSVVTYVITAYDYINPSATFYACGNGEGDPYEHVSEYSATTDVNNFGYGVGDFEGNHAFGGTPSTMRLEWTQTRHAEAIGIGWGSNTSVGTIVSDTGYISVLNYSLISQGVQYAADIEGVIYNTHYTISGGSVDNAFHVDSISNVEPVVWRRSGAFYSTSLDLRRNEEWGPHISFGYPFNTIPVKAANWESKIGLYIPAFVREGYTFVKWDGGYQATFNEASGSITGSTTLPESMRHYVVIPGLTGDGVLIGDPLGRTADQWLHIVNSSTVLYGASVNAGPTKCGIRQDNIFAAIYFPPILVAQYTPDQSFTGSANGIPVTDCTAVNATFVGAV